MENNNELKEVNIKNVACYYFNAIINMNNLDLDNILFDEKSFEDFQFMIMDTNFHGV